MRITTRISAAGNRSLTRLPMPNKTLEECLNESGKIDRVKAQLAFVGESEDGFNAFTQASTDDEAVYFAALTFLELFHDAFGSVCDNPDADINRGAVCRQDERLEKKIDQGKFVYARMNVRRTPEGVNVSLSVGNPKNIVGQSEAEAWEFITTAAQLWQKIAEQTPWISVECERDDILESARKRNADAKIRHEHEHCDRRKANGWLTLCSPAKFDCPFYKNGNCTYEERKK